MSFLAKKDYFNVADATLIITSSDENRSASLATAQNEKGDIVAQQMYGNTCAPSCTYVVKGQKTLSTLTMGDEKGSTGDERYVITGISISTGAATPPEVTISGEGVPTGSHCSNDCVYEVPSATLDPCHHAQALFDLFSGNEFNLTSGYYVTQANYDVECTLTKATKDGNTVAYDITEGKITAQLTIQGTGSTAELVVNADTGDDADDWQVTTPLSQSNPDSNYDTYTVTYTKNLSHRAVTP